MGVYLNSKKPYLLFRTDYASAYFVDKTEILNEFVPSGEFSGEKTVNDPGRGQKYVCITRPRRFGKTVMANMIASYFSKGIDSSGIFKNLKVSEYEWFYTHLNKHNVIHIMFNEIPKNCKTYEQYIERIESRLVGDLKKSYPDVEIGEDDAVWDALNNITEYECDERFIFVLDEWDFIYHQDFVTDEDKRAFTKFLSVLLKDQPYVELAYMTGILPIAKYSSGSELNMFFEYSMAIREKYSEYFGFTDEEVDRLYEKYLNIQSEPKILRKDLEIWYDGYQTASGIKLYNPRSVVGALEDNQLGNFWTSSGPYDEIYHYVKNDIPAIRDEITSMMTGNAVPANIQEYASTSAELKDRDEIYSAMVVYGFLSYGGGYVSIPNKELMDKFADMVRQRPEQENAMNVK